MSAALSASFAAAVTLEAAGRADLALYADPVVLLALTMALSPFPICRLLGTGREILQIAPPELDGASPLSCVRSPNGMASPATVPTSRAPGAHSVEVGFVAPDGSAATTFGELDVVRVEVAGAIGGFAPSCWLTVDFTANRRWV